MPCTGNTVKVRMLKIARNGGANIRYGRNFPQRECVRSAIWPIIGSLIASQIRAINTIAEMAAPDRPTISV